MNKSPLPTMLLAILAVLAIWSLFLCYTFSNRAGQIRKMQADLQSINANDNLFAALLTDASAYAKTHPAMENVLNPILKSLGAQGTAAAPATATGAKGATK